MSRRAITLALTAVAGCILVAHSLVWNFVTDDAFISFVYSRNLAEHGQLVFNLGERVEGYTNFLWTVLLALLMKVHLQPELMSRLLGTGCAVATMFVCTRFSRRLVEREASPWDALPAFLLAGVPGYACWSSGGLETQLFTMLVTIGATSYLVDRLERREPGLRSSVAFGLSALTRPEGLLFFALTVGHRALCKLADRKLAPTRRELAWLGSFCVLVVPHLLWRRWYYGYWLPNTFYIKSSAGTAAFAQGGYYLSQWVLQFHLWLVPLFALVALVARRDRALVLLYGYALLLVTVFCLYVASVGGDFMGLFRFAMPVVPLLALVASSSLRALLEQRRLALALPVVLVLLAAHAAHAVTVDEKSLIIGADRGIDTPGYLRRYTANRALIGKWFGQFASQDDYAAVGGAGAQVYYSGIASLDCFGLSDAYIAHRVRPLSNRPGHQKYAPVDYQLSKKPTIITSNYYRILPDRYVGGDSQWWAQRGYHYVSVQIPGLLSEDPRSAPAPVYSFLLRNDRSFGPLPKLGGAPPPDREP